MEPLELVPSDLGLLVRVDLARLRSAAPAEALDALRAQAFGRRGDALEQALGCGAVLWVAARPSSLALGDRIAIIEGGRCPAGAPPGEFVEVLGARGATVFERRPAPPREGTLWLVRLPGGATAFVSPVERDAVRRLLLEGPDPERPEPRARGLLSFELRPGRLGPTLGSAAPLVARLLEGLSHARGELEGAEGGLRLDATIRGRDEAAALRLTRVLGALLAGLGAGGEREGDLRVERLGATVLLRGLLPAALLQRVVGPPRASQEP